jgi:hypothetical protein
MPHLGKDCPFSVEVWNMILSWANLSFLSGVSNLGSLYDWWKRLMNRCCKESKKIFDGLIISGGIYSWKEITESSRDYKDLLSRLRNW